MREREGEREETTLLGWIRKEQTFLQLPSRYQTLPTAPPIPNERRYLEYLNW
jgi:hypothetical protein